MKKEKQKRGFTMIELLAVLVILGIIMVIAVPSVVSYLQGARSDYYDQLEESVKTVGQEYFSDHRSLMPRENGQIFSVNIQDLITEGYTTEILDSDGNDTCTGNVYVKRLATADFEYHACIQCGKTDAEGNQEYISTSAFCTGGTTGNNPDGECDKVKDDPTDDCFMIRIPNSFKVPQCTTVEDSAASQGISLEGIVLNNGEDIGDRVTADTTSVDYKNIGNYKVYYTYKQVLNPAGEKYNFGVTVYDDKSPSETTVEMHLGSSTGMVYNCSKESCSWTGQDIYITFTATDLSDCGTEGSGVKQFAYRYGESGNWQYVSANKVSKNGKTAYTATIVGNVTHNGVVEVKAIDHAKSTGNSKDNEGSVTKFYVMIDKTAPTVPTVTLKDSNGNAVPNGGSVVMQTITRTLSSTDGQSGIDHYEWSSDCSTKGGNEDNAYLQSDMSHVLTFSDTGNTANRACYRAVDKVGNASNWTSWISFTIVKQQKWEFSYTGKYQTLTIPYDGIYKLEVWGSQGESDLHRDSQGIPGGKGGYVAGEVSLKQGDVLTIVVGAIGYNGGAVGLKSCAGGGGGGTDIRYNGSRIIVAGGGGGSAGVACDADGKWQATYGGAGGAPGSGNLGNIYSGAGERGKINTGDGTLGTAPCGGGGGGGYAGGSGGDGYYSAAVGGSNFFDTNYGTLISSLAGVRNGSGYAIISIGY